MNLIDQQTLLLGGSLLILIMVNIILGSVSGLFKQQFDKKIFWQGLLKGVIIVICFCAVLMVSKLNHDILVVSVNDQNVDLGTAIQMLMTSSYAWYGLEIYKKMTGLLSGKYNVNETITSTKPVTATEDIISTTQTQKTS